VRCATHIVEAVFSAHQRRSRLLLPRHMSLSQVPIKLTLAQSDNVSSAPVKPVYVSDAGVMPCLLLA
jgi:hypothetical protein